MNPMPTTNGSNCVSSVGKNPALNWNITGGGNEDDDNQGRVITEVLRQLSEQA